MSKYINVDKLIAEIERLKSVLTDPLCSQGNILGPDWVAGGNKMLNEISSAISSLQQEQQKAELEEEMNKLVSLEYVNQPDDEWEMCIARHFYELGQNARKDE